MGYRADLNINVIEPGYILFLKRYDQIERQCLEESGLHLDALVHPVLVVSMDDQDCDRVTVCILTTLGGLDVEDRFHYNEAEWGNYLPIYPKTETVEDTQLFMKDNRYLRRDGYVNTTELYSIDVSMLDPYDWNENIDHYQLSIESFDRVMEEVEDMLVEMLEEQNTSSEDTMDNNSGDESLTADNSEDESSTYDDSEDKSLTDDDSEDEASINEDVDALDVAVDGLELDSESKSEDDDDTDGDGTDDEDYTGDEDEEEEDIEDIEDSEEDPD